MTNPELAPDMPELLPCPMEDLNSTFGQRIRFLREQENQSLQDVANAVGSSKAHIHELENGKSKNPSLNLVRGLAIHFMVPVAALVETTVTVQYAKRRDK